MIRLKTKSFLLFPVAVFLVTGLVISGFVIFPQKTFAIASFYSKQNMGDFQQINWQKSYRKLVTINQPLNKVWAYVSDSAKAIDWSIYFHHIKPISPDTRDGQVGAVRRCFRQENEQGVFWDEETLFVDDKSSKSRERVILSYNFNGFKLERPGYSTFVRQTFQALGENQTLLTFSTIPTEQMTRLDRIIFYFSRSNVEEIFSKNLENIKMQIEGNKSIHQYNKDSYTFFEK